VTEEDITLPHIHAAAKYVHRCRVSRDSRPVEEILCDILSPRDAALIGAALSDGPIVEASS
jgi:hypothetical protein